MRKRSYGSGGASGFDRVLKDLFQMDQPMLLHRITRGTPIKAFLNVELRKVYERRADLLLLLADNSLLHIEFQSSNDPVMAYRMAVYHLLLAELYRVRIRHVVIYVGAPKLTMNPSLDTGLLRFSYEIMDIREIGADAFLSSKRPGDYALAILAGGGEERLREIIGRIARLRGAARGRALTQLVVHRD